MNTLVSNRLVKVIFLSQSFFSAGAIAIFAVISITGYKLSGKESYAGVPTFIIIFSQALSAYPVSLIISRFGWRLGLTLGYVLGGLGAGVGVLAVQYGVFWPIIISGILLGIGRSVGELSRFAAGGMFEESKRARMIGRIVFASAIGAIVGPLLIPLSSNIVKNFGLVSDTGAWAISVLLYAVAAVIVFVYLKPDPNTISIQLDNPKIDEKLLNLFKIPQVSLAVLSMVISQLVMVILMLMTPLHIHKLHQTQEVISLVITAHVLGMYGFAAITGYLIDKLGHFPVLFAGAVTLASAAILAPLSNSQISIAFAMFLVGLGWNLCYVTGSSLVSSSLSHQARSKIQGLNDTIIALIAALASLAAGPIFFSGGYLAIGITGLIFTGGLLFLIYLYLKKIRSLTIEIK